MSKGIRLIAGVALIAFGAMTSWAGGAGLMMAGASLVVGAALEKTPAKIRRLQEQTVMVRSAVEPQELVFGEVKKSGVIAWYDANGPHNKYLWFVVAICEHQIDSYSELWIDGTRVNIAKEIDSGGFVTRPEFIDSDGNKLVKAGFYTGSDTQTASTDLVGQVGGYWTSAHRGKGVAYVWVRLEIDASKAAATGAAAQNVWAKGYPREIAVTMKGARVYDPRKDSTNGGTGSHRVSNPSTWQWSDNPILCRAHYIRHDRFGPGFDQSEIDWAVVRAQASVCDELVWSPVGNQKRYRLNGVVNTSDTGKAILEDMQTCDFGQTIFDPSGIKLLAGHWVAPSHTIDNTWLAGAVSGTSAVPADNNYNAVRGQYINSERDWAVTGFEPRTAAAYEQEDGIGRKYSDISLGFTTQEYYAQRIAIIELKKSRLQSTLTLECNFRAELVELYQTVYVKVDGYVVGTPGFVGTTFRVIQITSSSSGITTLTLREETPDAWNYDISEIATPPVVPTVLRGQAGPPGAINLTTQTASGGILVTWSLEKATGIKYAELYASTTNQRFYAARVTSALIESYLHTLPEGSARYYWIVTRGENGRPSDWYPWSATQGVYGIAGAAGDGEDGVGALLSNPSPVAAAAADGKAVEVTSTPFPLTIAGSVGTFKINEGGVDVSSGFGVAYSIIGGNGASPSQAKGQNGCYLALDRNNGSYRAALPDGVDSWTTDSESFVIRATYKGEHYDLDYKITKAKAGTAGADGDPGTAPAKVSVRGGTVRHVVPSGTATAVWYLYGDGREMTQRGSTVSNNGTWLKSGANSDYQVIAVSIGDDTPTGDTLGSPLDLTGSSVGWALTNSDTGSVKRAQLSVKILNKVTGVELSSGIVTLIAATG